MYYINFLRKTLIMGFSIIFLLINMLPVTATTITFEQQGITVTGTVLDNFNETLPGVNIVEKGTNNGTVTDVTGKFTITVAGANSVLQFSFIGYTTQETLVGDQRVFSIQMKEDSQALSEVVVIGYGTQQKRDITGSVAVVDTKELLKSSGASAVAQLQGKASGVYISTSGAAGGRSMVRIRGVNTLNDNGPLYVIDGVSTRNQDLSSLNPNDIESMQVLKDASASAIYGAQASNGVILITTKKGTRTGQPVLTYDGYFGQQVPGKKYDLLNSQDRMEMEWRSQENSLRKNGDWDKGKRPSHALFKTTPNGFAPFKYVAYPAGGVDTYDINDYFMPDKVLGGFDKVNVAADYSDTDWWNEVHRDFAPIQSHQIGLSGGTDKGTYQASVNVYDQKSVHLVRYFKRYTTRLNTSFNIRPWLRIGENVSFTWMRDLGRVNNSGEDQINSWVYRQSPWLPVYDLKGNFTGSKIPGTGNSQNPVALLEREKDNYWTNNRLFGNLWAEVDLLPGLTYNTILGIDYGSNFSNRMNKLNPEHSETTNQNNLRAEAGFGIRWQFTNTLTYKTVINNIHRLTAMAGTEAIRGGIGFGLAAQRENFMFEHNTNTWVLSMGDNNNNRVADSWYQGEFALFSIFGRIDYSLMDKYLLTVNVRRDGCSRFAKEHRYGTFPAASFGWRISEESFMMGTRTWLDDLKIRVGYGVVGNSELPTATNFASTFAMNANYAVYAINGGQTVSNGFRQGRIGNLSTKWESLESLNIGFDASLLKGKFGIGFEWYDKNTTDMLVSASWSSVAGDASWPYVNFGDMNNRGWDLTLSYHDGKGDFGWDITANLFHYKNTVVKMSEDPNYVRWEGGTRLNGSTNRTMVDRPIAELVGYKVDGFYESIADVRARRPLGVNAAGLEKDADAAQWIGRYRYAKNPDNEITASNPADQLNASDRMFLGNPHPKLIGSLNIGLSYKNFDFSTFWYSTIGNKMFNNTLAFTDFPLFGGNRSSRMRDNSWKADWEPNRDNSKATLPMVEGSSFLQPCSYFVEDASFLRMKNLVLGYSLPKEILKKATIQNLRIYGQVENLITITKYSGLDPENVNADLGQGSGADLRRGLDMGSWPNIKRFIIGVNLTF